VNVGGEALDRLQAAADRLTDLGAGGALRVPQPVVPHHALLIRIGDGAGFQGLHGREGPIERLGQPVHIRLLHRHPADVKEQIEIGEVHQPLLVALPGVGHGMGRRRRRVKE